MRWFILASGPSVNETDGIDQLPPDRTITVNNSWRRFPGADVHFSGDLGWWTVAGKDFCSQFKGKLKALCTGFNRRMHVANPWDAKIYYQSVLEGDNVTRHLGISINPEELRGSNSGQMAINLAYHLGAKEIILVGFDMGFESHRHFYPDGEFPECVLSNHSTYPQIYVPTTESVKAPLEKLGVKVVNCTPKSALKAFTFGKLTEYV
jgi:hypothetical protein